MMSTGQNGFGGDQRRTPLREETSALQQIAQTIGGARTREELESRWMELVFRLTPAERVAVVLTEEGLDRPAAVFGSDEGDECGTPLEVSRSVMEWALREGRPRLAGRESGIGAAPIIVSGRVRGVIYAEGTNSGGRLDESHLRLLMTLGTIAAPALEQALEEDRRRIGPDRGLHRDESESAWVQILLGRTPAMRRIRELIARIGPADCTVLIQGESGTGKELAARAIHLASPRSACPLAPINCAALTEPLLESELFGHERGAFTGAVTAKQGKIEMAEGGTLLLDEIGTMPLGLQAKLLRVIEERQFERLGGLKPVRVDFRLVAATNADLEAAVAAGSFRVDLYHRLRVVNLVMPPLRERKQDIVFLADHFAREFGAKAGRRFAGFSPAAIARLESYSWPGNVRELRNAMEHAMVMGSTDVVAEDDLPETLYRQTGPPAQCFRDAAGDAKREIIRRAFTGSGGCHAEAARALGMNPTYFSRLVHRLEMKEELNAMARRIRGDGDRVHG